MEFVDRLTALAHRDLPLTEFVKEFSGLAVWTGFDDATLNSLFWIGANYHRPVDLPDTTGLRWREGILQCLESVLLRSRTNPPTAARSSPPSVAPLPLPPSAAKSVFPPSASKPDYPRARKWASNSADLRAKVLDPSITSVRSALKSKPRRPNPPPFAAHASPPTQALCRSRPT